MFEQRMGCKLSKLCTHIKFWQLLLLPVQRTENYQNVILLTLCGQRLQWFLLDRVDTLMDYRETRHVKWDLSSSHNIK